MGRDWRRRSSYDLPVLFCLSRAAAKSGGNADRYQYVPVNIDMAEIGREDRQSTVNILTIAIPSQECRHGKSVPEIM